MGKLGDGKTALSLGAAASAAVLSAIGLMTATSDATFEQRIAAAAASSAGAQAGTKVIPRDGSEAYWLSLKPTIAITPVSNSQPLAVGLELPKGLDTAGRDLEIVSIRRIEDDGREQLLLVTCRNRKGDGETPVRLLIQMPAQHQVAQPRIL